MYACFMTRAVVSMFVFVCGVVPSAPSFTTYLVSSPTHMKWGCCVMHGLVTYLCAIPLFPRGPWPLACGLSLFLWGGFSCVLFFCFCASLFVSSFLTRKSGLASTARTFLGGLGHATFNFAAVVALLFLIFPACPTVLDLAKQRRTIVLGVSEVGKHDCYFFWLCFSFFVFYFFSAAIGDASVVLKPEQVSLLADCC